MSCWTRSASIGLAAKVILLTGYNEFDYVYKAIHQKDVNYLLKTEGDEAITAAVENAVAEIKREMTVEQLIEKAKRQMQLALPLLQKDYLVGLLEMEAPAREEMEARFTGA